MQNTRLSTINKNPLSDTFSAYLFVDLFGYKHPEAPLFSSRAFEASRDVCWDFMEDIGIFEQAQDTPLSPIELLERFMFLKLNKET